jgi:hypothetical protein
MCCLFTGLIFFGPRLAFVLYWLTFGRAAVSAAFETTVAPILGVIFLPWTTFFYVLLFPIEGAFDWILLGFSIAADIASYWGGLFNRKRVPYYTGP